MTNLGFEKQSQWIRYRYYQNMTFMDGLAKAYGELGWIKQNLLLIVSISPCCFFYINPTYFVVGCILGSILLLLRSQYEALETRFQLLIEDIEYSENEMDKMMSKNHELEKQIMLAFEKNESAAKTLDEASSQIQLIEQQCIEDQKKASLACQTILGGASQTTEMTAEFIALILGSLEKTKNAVMSIDETLSCFKSTEDFLLTKEQMKAIIDFRKAAEANLIKKFGPQYLNFSEAYDKKSAGLNRAY